MGRREGGHSASNYFSFSDIFRYFQTFSDMGKDYELVSSTVIDEENMEQIYMKIIDEKHPVIERNLSSNCACEDICEDCEEKPINIIKISEGEAVLRNRFKVDETNDELKTSSFDVDKGGWIERDPETTQTFKRKEQVRIRTQILKYSK